MLKRKMIMMAVMVFGVFLYGVSLPAESAAEEVLSSVEVPVERLTFDRFYQKVFSYYPTLKAAHGNVEVALAE